MASTNAQEAFRIIDKYAELADFDGPKSDSLISRAESRLKVRFPPSYREFVRRYGAGDISGHEFYGIISEDFDNSGIPDAVWITENERMSSSLPWALVIVYTTPEGFYYAIDCSRVEPGGESPVVAWIPGTSTDISGLQVVASDFGSLLKEMITRAVK